MSTAPEGLRRWRDPAVVSAAGLACLAGFGQFGVIALLGDLAQAFGEQLPENGVVAEVGMTATTVGIGLALIRLASIASLPAAAIADRLGRRRVLVGACAIGLLLTVASAGAPTWWWFVAIFALGRPLLTGTNAVAAVIAAEETATTDRSKAIALVGAAYAVGSGLFAIMRAAVDPFLGFRGILLLVAVPLAVLPLVGRHVSEPARYEAIRSGATHVRRTIGHVRRDLVPRLVVLCAIHAAVGVVTGPMNTYLFLYGERIQGLTPVAMTALFVSAGATGLAGLLIGRWGADVAGRRVTAGLAMALGATFGFVAYSGGVAALAVGYPLMIFMASAFTPAAGSLDAELFPTSVRATAAGWIAAAHIVGQVVGISAFGLLVDAFQAFGSAAALIAAPVVAISLLYRLLPETRGLELEESAPDDIPPTPSV